MPGCALVPLQSAAAIHKCFLLLFFRVYAGIIFLLEHWSFFPFLDPYTLGGIGEPWTLIVVHS